MSTHPVPGDDTPQITEEGGGSTRITIPAPVRDELDLEGGEEPAAVKYNPDTRRVAFEF